MIAELLIFITMWIAFCGLWHEYMHALAGHLTKVNVDCIVPVFSPYPSFKYHYSVSIYFALKYIIKWKTITKRKRMLILKLFG